MKNWYFNLKNKKIVHIILIILNIVSFFIVGSSDEDSNVNLFVWLWMISGVLEVVFLIFEYQFRKNQKNNKIIKQKIINEVPIVHKEEKVNITEETQKKKIIESNKNYNKCTEYNGIKYALKYTYRENLCFVENLDKVNLEDNNITYHLEKDNEYDPNTIAVYVGNIRIGLMYKGDCRDIIVKCIKSKKYEVAGFICKLDVEKQEIAIKVGFFKPLDKMNSITASIIKTSKIDELTQEKRYEQLEWLSEGDILNLEESYESDGLLVLNETGYEIGELSASISEKISEEISKRHSSLENLIVTVDEISYGDNLKVKVKVRIYFDI